MARIPWQSRLPPIVQRQCRTWQNPIDELTALIDVPFDNDVSCIEYEEERERSMSDDSVMLCLKDEFGITYGQQVQKPSKEQRDVILAALLRKHAGVRQLQRLTGIGKNIISNVSKKYISRQDSDLSPVPLILYKKK